MHEGVCRDCGASLAASPATRCPSCGSRRLKRHAEMHRLAIAHLDCDAFYASVEKRDNPALADKPVIVGGGRRGVVSACCYIARLYGVRSAMPMFKALRACPHAVVVPSDMRKYQAVGRQVRALMADATPLVEPLSIDEAFLDLSGTEAVHGASPAQTLARLVTRIEREVGVTASIGLSYNKFLAKVASDLDKPRGFAVIGRAEARSFLAPRPVELIWGVGPALRRKLSMEGIHTIGDLARLSEHELSARYGAFGRRLYAFARGEDSRTVDPRSDPKSVSAETTFDTDISDAAEMERQLWPLCETVARRLKASDLSARGVVLKLKANDFRQITRSVRLSRATQLAPVLFDAARVLLARAADGTRFRLIGVGTTELGPGTEADPPDLFDPGPTRRAALDQALDEVRRRLGPNAVQMGRNFGKPPE